MTTSASPWAATYPLWGWGADTSRAPTQASLAQLGPAVRDLTGVTPQEPERPGPLRSLPPDRVTARVPAALAHLVRADAADRARHGLGRSYRDVVRGLRGRPDHVPDAVARPRDEADVEALLSFATAADVAVVPFGGGTSVVGGVEPATDGRPVLSLDTRRLSGVTEVDTTSRAARVRGGTLGPELEAALAPHGLTARFYPQSFERSTVGGWLATRAGGHFSTGSVHVDDLVESVRAVTPAGVWESRRLPGSGAGPSPDRLLLGSEGTLGVLTSAWLRVQPRPGARWAGLASVPTFRDGLELVRTLVQAGVPLSAARVLDAQEAALSGTSRDGTDVVVLGLESLGPPLDDAVAAVQQAVADTGGRLAESGGRGEGGTAWRSAFLGAPYLRDSLVVLGVLVETFETATTWDRAADLVDRVLPATRAALAEVCGGGTVTVRTTHAYRDGVAPYVTVLAPTRRGAETEQWAEVKAAATEAVLAAGGTVTHHHAVGRDHRPAYDRQRPDVFAAALRGAQAAVDPAGVMNPGVLLPAGARGTAGTAAAARTAGGGSAGVRPA